jgi:lysophospholipase L1-like esterase
MSHSSSMALRVLMIVTMLGWRWVPREWIPSGLNQIRWALGCDEIENVERLLNRAETERMDQGYYNNLLDTGLEHGLSPPICQTVAELREVVLVPNLSIVRAKGTTWRTNELGMRDRTYAASKPAGAFRIAMTGDSIGVALGVSEGMGFEPALEQWLSEQSHRRNGPVVEILNFSLPGRSPGQRWDHFQKVGWAMQPDLVLFEATAADIGWDHRRLAEVLARDIGWDSTLYGDILKHFGARPGATSAEYARALRPYRWDLLAAVYRAVAADCRTRGVPCLWVLIPRVGRVVGPDEHCRLLCAARAAGFTAVVDISDAFDDFDPADLAIHPSDFHPNAEGHALLARRLAQALWPLPALRPLQRPSPGATHHGRKPGTETDRVPQGSCPLRAG